MMVIEDSLKKLSWSIFTFAVSKECKINLGWPEHILKKPELMEWNTDDSRIQATHICNIQADEKLSTVNTLLEY